MISKINEAILQLVTRFQREEGQTLSEYGLILALVAVAAVVALGVLAAAITGTLGSVASSLTGATSGS
jgi:pilus assembly protein Flp/PilA